MNGKDNALYDAVRLHALTLRLFDYARKEKEIIKNSKLSANEMNSALKASYGHTKTYMAHTDPDQSMGKLIKRIEKEHT